jgi:hypothetical protein
LLIFHGTLYNRTHNLLVLLEPAISMLPELAQFQDLCGILTDCAVTVRYPGYDELDRSDLLIWMRCVEDIMTMINSHCHYTPPSLMSRKNKLNFSETSRDDTK